jgi:nitronate monooxygenase
VHHQPASYPLQVTGAHPDDDTLMHFDPSDYFENERLQQPLPRPKFLPIVSSNTLALTMLKRANGSVEGFILEGATAGGHNAPPRGKLQLNESGEPIYGERDAVGLEKIRELGVPFWLAGGFGSAGRLQAALDEGAAGVQVGTAFACCEESGLHSDYKQLLVRQALMGVARVFTDPMASPTGFPFKVAQIEGTASDPKAYAARPRVCDIGFLREPYRTADGSIGYRCSGEPVTCYVSKGGKMEDSVGRKCICNALVANIGLPQVRNDHRVELAIVTMGDDLKTVGQFLRPGESSYSAQDVVEGLLGSQYDRLSAMPAVNLAEACEAVC